MLKELVTAQKIAASEKRPAAEKDKNDVFGDLMASQMKKLPDVLKNKAKHQISNIIYEMQMKMYHHSNSNQLYKNQT